MTVYMVERNLAGISLDQLAAAQKAAITTARNMREQGSQIRYIRSTFVPERHRCMCLFEAGSPDLVRQLNDSARIPYEGIVEAYDLTPNSPDL
jgi:hypothetical protein